MYNDDLQCCHRVSRGVVTTCVGILFGDAMSIPFDTLRTVIDFGVARPFLDYHGGATIEDAIQMLCDAAPYTHHDDDNPPLDPLAVTLMLHSVLRFPMQNVPGWEAVGDDPHRSYRCALHLMLMARPHDILDSIDQTPHAFTQNTPAAPFLGLVYRGIHSLPRSSWYVGPCIHYDETLSLFGKDRRVLVAGDTIELCEMFVASFEDDGEHDADADSVMYSFTTLRGIVFKEQEGDRLLMFPPARFVVDSVSGNHVSLTQVEAQSLTLLTLHDGGEVCPLEFTGDKSFSATFLDPRAAIAFERMRETPIDAFAFYELAYALPHNSDIVVLPDTRSFNRLELFVEAMRAGVDPEDVYSALIHVHRRLGLTDLLPLVCLFFCGVVGVPPLAR